MPGGPLDAAAQMADRHPSPAASAQSPPALVSVPTPAADVPMCERPAVLAALRRGDDDGVVRAMGGGPAMHAAVVAGTAPCVDLQDPARMWMVVDKMRPYRPLDFEPAHHGRVKGIRALNEGVLRTDAGAALATLVAAARRAGAGELALTSGFRSYRSQVSAYGGEVASKGRHRADAVSARPGYSEHQSGLAADMIACRRGGGCSGIESLAATRQGRWLAENAWRYGFIVRYEACCTNITGYSPEPWHIRYIGVELAKTYRAGGFHTLEEFWGLSAAPDYQD